MISFTKKGQPGRPSLHFLKQSLLYTFFEEIQRASRQRRISICNNLHYKPIRRGGIIAVTKLNPYINFKGKTKESIEFYKSVFGGVLSITTFKEGGMSSGPTEDNLIIHAELIAENGMTLMISDIPDRFPYTPGKNIGISHSGDNVEELQGFWDKLTVGGTVSMPYTTAPWGDTFGMFTDMFTDRFGIDWMINCAGKKA